jgi:hypothetical protein
MRTLLTIILSFMVGAFSSPLFAQSYPIPFVNNPLVPAAVVPGGPGFTLTVNGTGFVAGDVVRWNGTALATTFVNAAQLTAQVPATNIKNVGTIFVTASTPPGGISNFAYFEITTPTSSLAYSRIDTDYSPQTSPDTPFLSAPSAVTVADFTNSGIPYLAIANNTCPIELQCGLNANASITLAISGLALNVNTGQRLTGSRPNFIGTGDFGGEIDLITEGPASVSFLAGGFGTNHKDTALASGSSGPFASGDFNRDGNLDLAIAGGSGASILPGDGTGGFGSPALYDQGAITSSITVGDFNGDGNLDLAVANEIANSISILPGNGDGTFQAPVDYPAGPLPGQLLAADFNHDGHLDLALISNVDASISVFLGNADGTFQPKVDYPAGISVVALTIGDYDGDGILDLAATDSLCNSSPCPATGSVNVLLGNGDGTFKSHLDFAAGGQPVSVATGEFKMSGQQGVAVGRPGFATANQQDDTVSVFLAVPTGLVNSIPTVTAIAPLSAPVNSAAFTITVNGTNFVAGSTVYFAGQARATTFVSSTQLTAQIQGSDLSIAGLANVMVVNPPPGGGDSTSIAFNVFGPPAMISALNPSSVVAGGPAFTLLVNGLNFVNGAVVSFKNVERLTTFLSTTQLAISISVQDIAKPGAINITVTDPFGNGGDGSTSSPASLTILPVNVQPVVGALVPASTTAGSPSFTLTIAGTGFTASSVVSFNSRIVSSEFVSATQLQAAIPASSVAVGANVLVTVANPGGNPSVVVTFTVNNPVPAFTALSPSAVAAGSAGVILTVTGSQFTANSVVLVSGTPRLTTLVSTTSLNAALLATDFTHSGTLSITVSNPAPGGGTTPALGFAVTDFSVTVATVSPAVTAGQAASFTLTVTPASKTTTTPVTLAIASPLPPGATATFSPFPTVSAGSGPTTLMLSIATTARSTIVPGAKSGRKSYPSGRYVYLLALAIALVGLGPRIFRTPVRRLVPQFALALLLLCSAGLVACGGAGGVATGQSNVVTAGTPAGNYSIVVTATSGSGALTTAVSLTVM